ncbi:MAG: hypothetical protein IJG84_22065 [Kiritimatiellae bacterium]|nr:hypothetical protein [Kiritimatiellia bacterium]
MQAKKGKREARMAGVVRMAALLAVLCTSAAALGYSFREDFSVSDDVGESYGIDIEQMSHYSHRHGRVMDGRYAILLNGNLHCLRTPKLRDFRLALDWNIETTHSGGPGYGLVVHFRRNRETGAGHMLELFMERNTSRFSFSLDGRDIAVSEGFRVDMEKVQRLMLEVKGTKGRVSACGVDAAFELPEGEAAGHVALDAASDSQQQLYIREVALDSPEEPAKERIAACRLQLDKSQGFQMPVVYDVTLSRYETGETLLEAELSGTTASRPLEGRVITNGGEWGSVQEKVDTPYVRVLDAKGAEFSKCNFWNGEKTLRDPCVPRRGKGTDEPWPKHMSVVYFGFPSAWSLAAGYRHAIAHPWRFAEEGPREQIVARDGRVLYDGTPLLGRATGLKVRSPADKRLVSKIPADIPKREAALKHAREQHYFYESEKVRFDVESYFLDAEWSADEMHVEAKFTDVYGDAVSPSTTLRDKGSELMPCGIRRATTEVSLDGFLKVGVYKLVVNGRTTVFEVLPDDPNGPCPPLASGLPTFVSMPNEIKYLEQNILDPWGDVGGVAHYYSVDNRYPLVGDGLEIWRLMSVYRRWWWCWNWSRNSNRLEMRSEWNKELIRHANAFGGADERYAWDGRYELGVVNYYTGFQLKLLRDFLKERGLESKVPTPEPFTYEALKTLFETCWRDWVDYARPRIDANAQEFVDYLLSVNPKVAQATYGPYAYYVTHYKTAYQLTYGGYPMVDDPRLRRNGSFWLFEEYHHSCDYPLFRPAFFVATYDLHFGDRSRRIFPEIYYSGWGRCLDGAVYMAHPLSRTYLADVHQRRVAYQYVYGTPQFAKGGYKFWKDYGFHARNPENGAMEEFVHAWGNIVKNEPRRAHKAPFVVHDLDALRRNGEYFDEECNSRFRLSANKWRTLSDIGNSAEDDVAYAFEQAVVNGYATPVTTTFADIGDVDSGKAEFVVIPPIVEGTPRRVLDSIRALHDRGVGIVAFEQVAGLEDLFGVRRVADRPVGYLPGEPFSHKLAKARYAADGAEVLLWAAERPGAAMDIPLVVKKSGAKGRTVFVNAPASSIRRVSFRTVFHWGQDSLSTNLKEAMREAYAFLAPDPAVKSDHGLVSSAFNERGDLVVVVSDEPPIYKDREVYPVPMRFVVQAPRIGEAEIKADAPYSVVSRGRDRVVVRVRMDRDSAYFFKFALPR